MATDSVTHFISVEPEAHLITRARIVTGRSTDDVSLFIGDRIAGTLQLPRGRARDLCVQLGLVERTQLCTFEEIKRQFSLALQE